MSVQILFIETFSNLLSRAANFKVFVIRVLLLVFAIFANFSYAVDFEECAELYSDNGAIPGDPNCKILASTVSVGLGNFGCRTFSGPRYVDQYCELSNIQASTDWLDLGILRENYLTEKQDNSPDVGFAHQFLCIAEQSCNNFESSGTNGWAAGFVKFLFDDMDDDNGMPESVETNCEAWMSKELCFLYKGFRYHSVELVNGFTGYCRQEGVLVDYERWDKDHNFFLDAGVRACFADVANAQDLSPQFAAAQAADVPEKAEFLRERTQDKCRIWNFLRSSGTETGNSDLHFPAQLKASGINPLSDNISNQLLPVQLQSAAPIREDFYDIHWDNAGSLAVSITDDVFFVKPGDQVSVTVTGNSGDGSIVNQIDSDRVKFRLLTNNRHASISEEGLLTIQSTPSPFSIYSLADVVLVLAVAGDEYGVGQAMIIDDDSDGDTLWDSFEDNFGSDKLTANDIFADSDNNGKEDLEDALNFLSTSSHDDSINNIQPINVENDEASVTGPDANTPTSGGGASIFVFILLIARLGRWYLRADQSNITNSH